ncbi:DMT family transporter [Brevibacillus migulae]|uniref:DMT family transporter n=1 Tax=Brevibacillus migulae TaxID=1644114 RepID=UPI00106E5F3B|nr:DMT family transporter [Brevibacillus migulae]
MNAQWRGSIFVFLSAAGFGVMSILAEYAYQVNVSIANLLFWRFLLAAVLFFLLLIGKKETLRVNRKQLVALIGLGGVLYTLQSFSFFSAVDYISPSMAALLLYSFPIFVSILSYWLEKEKLNKQTLGAMLLSVCGLALVLGNAFDGLHPLGILFGFGAAVFYSFYIVLGNRVVQTLPPLLTSAYISLFASVSFLLFSFAGDGLRYDLPGQAWGAIAGIVLFSTVMAIVCFFAGLRLIGATKASVLSTIEPVVTSVIALLLLGDQLSLAQMAGGLLVLSGAALIVITRSGEKKELRLEISEK